MMHTTVSTGLHGHSGSEVCDTLFSGRCDTSAPGTFCTVIDAGVADRVTVQMRDVLHNTVTLDAGNMTDERTGATVIPAAGGVVTFPADRRYQALIPDGTFTQPTIVQLTPITDSDLQSSDPAHPEYAALTNPDLQTQFGVVGTVRVDLDPPETMAQRNFDVTFPAPTDATTADQYLATRVISFRTDANGNPRQELTMIDTAQYDATNHVVVTQTEVVLPGLTIGGTFGLLRVKDCVGLVTGWVSVADYAGTYVGGSVFGGMMPFPIFKSAPLRFTVPIPCDQSVSITLRGVDDHEIDTGCGCAVGASASQMTANTYGGQCVVPKAGVAALQCTLSAQHQAPTLQTSTIQDGDDGVDPLTAPQMTFDSPVNAPAGAVTLTGTDPRGRSITARGRVVVSGSSVTFVPDIRLRYGATYTLAFNGLTSLTGDPLPPTSITFTTFQPAVLQHIGIDARDVAWLDPTTFPPSAGLSACTDLIAVAEGDAVYFDDQRGISFYDVTDLSTTPQPIKVTLDGQQDTTLRTAGLDRALKFAPAPPVQPKNVPSPFPGPFLMSVDGGPSRCPTVGNTRQCAERFGAWRLWDLSQFPAVTRVMSRLINESAEGMSRIAGDDDPLRPPSPYDLISLLSFVPNDIGIPEDLASFGTQSAYVANAPFIGLQVLIPSQMDSRLLVDDQVQGTFRGTNQAGASVPIRSVSTLTDAVSGDKDTVLTIQELQQSQHRLVLLTPGLNQLDTFLLGARANRVKGLKGWPMRLDPGADTTVERDLAVVTTSSGVQVLAVNPPGDAPAGGGAPAPASLDTTGANLAPGLSPGIGRITTPGGNPNGVAYDPDTQLLFVADGTAGLTIIDLSVPGGSRDDDGDGVDDRVLGTVRLDGALAERVAVWRNPFGKLVIAVAAGRDGVFLIDDPSPPAIVSLKRPSVTGLRATGCPLPVGTPAYVYSRIPISGPNPPDVAYAAGNTSQTHPNSAILIASPNSDPNGAPVPGGLATMKVTYTSASGATAADQVDVAAFGLSCYATPDESSDFIDANGSCTSITYRGTDYSPTTDDPPDLTGNFCTAFLLTVWINGSGRTRNGTLIHVNDPPPASFADAGFTPIAAVTGGDGSALVPQRTLARDRGIIPQNPSTRVSLDGMGNDLLANDIGGSIRGYRIDLYMGIGLALCDNYPNPIKVGACRPPAQSCPGLTR